MTKRILKNLLWILLLATTVSFLSCDKEDKGAIGGEAKVFVGDWVCSSNSNSPSWTFRDDGTCTMKGTNTIEGNWTYNAATKRLATDCSNWIWDVQLTTESTWSGVGVSSGSVYSYKRIGGTNGVNVGSIIVSNKYVGSGHGSINSVAIINSEGKYVKTSVQSIAKGASQTFTSIPVDTYTINYY